jgi:carboxypeptidase Q
MKRRLLLFGFLASFSFASFAQDDKPDLSVVKKIREEGLNHSKVMETAFYLTDVNGPRLQNGVCKMPNWNHGANGAKAGNSSAATSP